MQMKPENQSDDMLPEYDFRGGTRGRYAERLKAGSNLVVLEPDVAEVFGTSDEVNAALRALIGVMQRQSRPRTS